MSAVLEPLATSVLVQDGGTLAKLDHARQMLAECRTLPEVKRVRDIAEAARIYAKAAHLSKESQNYAAEIALLAACKAGEILKQLERSIGGDRRSNQAASVAGCSEYRKTLDETGTAERTAQYWQKLAEIPAASINAYVTQAKETHQDLGQNGLLKFYMREERAKNPQPVSPKPAPTIEAQDFTAKITAFRTELGMLNAQWLRAQNTKDNEDLITLAASLRTMAKEVMERAKRIESAIRSVSEEVA
jgi:hypothetical protein